MLYVQFGQTGKNYGLIKRMKDFKKKNSAPSTSSSLACLITTKLNVNNVKQ